MLEREGLFVRALSVGVSVNTHLQRRSFNVEAAGVVDVNRVSVTIFGDWFGDLIGRLTPCRELSPFVVYGKELRWVHRSSHTAQSKCPRGQYEQSSGREHVVCSLAAAKTGVAAGQPVKIPGKLSQSARGQVCGAAGQPSFANFVVQQKLLCCTCKRSVVKQKRNLAATLLTQPLRKPINYHELIKNYPILSDPSNAQSINGPTPAEYSYACCQWGYCSRK